MDYQKAMILAKMRALLMELAPLMGELDDHCDPGDPPFLDEGEIVYFPNLQGYQVTFGWEELKDEDGKVIGGLQSLIFDEQLAGPIPMLEGYVNFELLPSDLEDAAREKRFPNG